MLPTAPDEVWGKYFTAQRQKNLNQKLSLHLMICTQSFLVTGSYAVNTINLSYQSIDDDISQVSDSNKKTIAQESIIPMYFI